MTGVATPTEVVSAAPWRPRLFVSTSEQRLRLPRDLIGGVGGALVACGSWVIISTGVGSAVELRIPMWIAGLVTLAAIVGTSAFTAISALLCAGARRWMLLIQAVGASGASALTCVAVFHGLDRPVGFAPPIVAATFAMAVLVVRTLVLPLRSPLWAIVLIGTVAEIFDAHLVPLGTLGAASLGVSVSALLAFVLGTQDVAPTIDEAAAFLQQLGVAVERVRRSPITPAWGATRFSAIDGDGQPVDIDIFGRDAPEGQALARVWRFIWVRRSTLDLRLRRTQHIEHSVGMMLWVRAQGIETPTVVVAGTVEPSDDAILVTCPPRGRTLAEHSSDEVEDTDIFQLWNALGQLDSAGIALGSVRVDSIVLTPDHRVGFLDFANAEAMAPPDSRAADAAALLIATAEIVGPTRAIDGAIEACGPDRVAALLPLIQPQVLPTDPDLRTRKRTKGDLKGLRLTAAEQLGIPPVEPQPLARVQLSKLLLLAGTFLGIWLLVEQLVGLQDIGHLISNANWWWFLAVLLITQATAATEAVCLSGAMPGSPPIGPLTMLRLAMNFTGMIGGTVATTATVVRFNQRRGSPPAVAISSGLIYSVTGFIVQIVLTLIALVFAADEFHRATEGAAGSGPENLELILYAIVAVSFVVGVAFVTPKIRRVLVERLRPRMQPAWENVRQIARDPGRLVRLFGGAVVTQLMMAAGLGLALRSVGESASFGGLVIVCTFTALLGGMAPVPGGMGVMEASYIAGLTLLGIPQDAAIAATLLYRLATTYLPPIWGWGAMVWLRRRDAL